MIMRKFGRRVWASASDELLLISKAAGEIIYKMTIISGNQTNSQLLITPPVLIEECSHLPKYLFIA
jgi:hypothetical protein